MGPEMATARFDSNEGLLTLLPASPLVANESYHIEWPALRGISTAVLGKGAAVTFTVGASPDKACTEFRRREIGRLGRGAIERRLHRRRRRSLSLRHWAFAGKRQRQERSALAGRIYKPLGLHLRRDSPSRCSSSDSESIKAEFGAPSTTAKGNVVSRPWFETRWGRISSSAEHEVCTKTVKPPFFYGCTMAPPASSHRGSFRPPSSARSCWCDASGGTAHVADRDGRWPCFIGSRC